MADHHEYCCGGFLPDDIVISGMSGRFPQCQNIEELSETLLSPKNLLIQTCERYEKGAFDLPFGSSGTIQNVDKFDAKFFGFASTAANSTDPMQRKLLEVSYEAIVDAGYEPTVDFRGANIGVYTAVTDEDAREIISSDLLSNPNFTPGFLRCILANRCSYFFDFGGPSYTVDTACSSSLVALTNAVQDLKDGRIEAALVNAGELAFSPVVTTFFQRVGILSPTAESHPFEARGNGMVRAEAVSAFFVQKASQARRVYATIHHIKHAATGYNPEGIHVPSLKGQVKLYTDMLREANLTTNDIQYVEAHGTGTVVGDPIEIKALEVAFCPEREKPLYVGSVKSHLGHSVAASGQSGTAKAILAFETGFISPNAGFEKPNPKSEALMNGTIKVLKEPLPLTTPYILVNAFGFGGSIVQVILKKNPIEYSGLQLSEDIPRLVLYPATTEEAIKFLFEYVAQRPDLRNEFFALLNKLSFAPTAFKPFRGYALYQDEKPVIQVKNSYSEKREVWFVMTGMGSQWPGMGLEMMRIKEFADSMRKSAAVLKSVGVDLFELLRDDRDRFNTLKSAVPALVSIAAVQIALVDVLSHLEIQPDHVMGHSAGELVCAYVDGCFTAEQVILTAYWRGKSFEESDLEVGAMAAVGLTWEDVARRCPKDVYPACHNAEDSVTISGLKEPVEKFVEELQSENIFTRIVNSQGIAFHSKYIHPASSLSKTALSKVIKHPKPRTERWISTCYAENEWNTEDCRMAGAEYFVHNQDSVVRFSDGLKKIPADAIVIEIGPHFLFQSIIKRSVGPKATYVGLMKKDYQNNIGFFLESLGKLYLENLNPKIEKLYRPVKFPVPRATPFISSLIRWDYSQSWFVPKWKPVTTSFTYQFHVESVDNYLLDHQMNGKPIFPAAGYIFLAWKALSKKVKKNSEDVNVILEDIKIHRATILDPSQSITFDVNIMDSSGRFEIMEGNSLVSTGKVYEDKNETLTEPFPEADQDSSTFVSGDDIYNELSIVGYEYGPTYRGIVEVNLDVNQGFAEWKGNWITFLDSICVFFTLNRNHDELALPTRATSIKMYPKVLKKYVQERLETNLPSGLPVYYDSSSKVVRSPGVEIRDLVMDFSPQRPISETPFLEEYKFVPYINASNIHSSEKEDFVKYMIACNKVIVKLQTKIKKGLSSGKFYVDNKFDFDVDDYINVFNKEHSLLNTLKTMADIDADGCGIQEMKEIASKFIEEMGKDLANTLLLNDRDLRFMLDIISENITRKFNILEIQNGLPFILPLLVDRIEKFLTTKFKDKSLVFKNEGDVDKNKITDYSIQLRNFDYLKSLPKESGFDVVIGAICTTTKEKAREHIRLLSSVVEKRGFIMLFHKNNLLPPEKLLASISGKTVGIVPSDLLESWFVEEDLLIVSKLSDNACSSFYLLRHTTHTEKLKVINMSSNSDWFNELKASFSKASQTLWVVSDDEPTSGVVGMVNCLRQEPGGDKVRCMFIPDRSKDKNIPLQFSTKHPFFQDILKKDLTMNVHKNGSWGSFRHFTINEEASLQEVENSFVSVKKYGDASSLFWMESAVKYIEIPDYKFAHVYYAAINHKDVMLANGKLFLPKELGTSDCDRAVLGFEFSGKTKSGERIAGICRLRGLATTTQYVPELTIKVPAEWSLEEAATVPVAYATCYYALNVRGDLKSGERILIRSAADDVGQAALNIAMSMNCHIFVTVDSENKQHFLMKTFPKIKVENIITSQNTNFEDVIMKRTNGKGVDVVFNTLPGDKYEASVRCVAYNGRFIDIRQYDEANDYRIGLKYISRNIDFHSIKFDQIVTNSVPVLRRIQALIADGIRNGVVKPLQRAVFQRDEVEEAFRYMTRGTYFRKILIKIRNEEAEKFSVPQPLQLPAVPNTYFYAHKVYIVLGGLGGFGIEVCKWLLSRGATTLVVTSRYGARSPYHHLCLKRWKDKGYRVIVSTREISIKEEAVQFLKEVSEAGPVGGIFNSAMVRRDAFLENMNLESFKEACAPKVEATKNLDVLSRCFCPELDHFVCFSSLTSGRGTAGQMNYGYANSVMERICEKRQTDGLPGLAIQWGFIGDVGIAHREMGNEVIQYGLGMQRVKSCLDSLNLSCILKHPVTSSYVMKDPSTRTDSRGDILQQLAKIFGLKDQTEFHSSRKFSEMGMDSMTGVEVKNLLESTFDVSFSVQEIQEMKISDVKTLMEKTDRQTKDNNSSDQPSVSSISLPNPSLNDIPVQPLNAIQNGTPLFILDNGNLEQLRCLGEAVKNPAFALLLSNEAPIKDVPSLASWYLQKIAETSKNKCHILAHKSSTIVALEMILQSQKLKSGIPSLTVLCGVSSLVQAVSRETKWSDEDILCDFVESYVPSANKQLKQPLSKAGNFEQKLDVIADFLSKSSKKAVNKTELSNTVAAHMKILRILKDYTPKEKLKGDLLVIEDSSLLLPNEVESVKNNLSKVCAGKITIRRIPDILHINENNVQKIASAIDPALVS